MNTPTLDSVRERGALRAAVSRGIRGLSLRDGDGGWSGLDADVARAVAAAALGSSDAVEWAPTDPADRLGRLAAGEVDLTVCNVSWTLGREAALPVLFAGVTCYDGEGFLVRADSGITRPEELAGRRVAVQAGTTSAANLASWYGGRGLSVEPVAFATPGETLAAYAAGECAAYVLDRVALAGERAALDDPAAHRILDAAISREPMAAAVRDDDPAWFRLCRWVLQLLVSAEHHADEVGERDKALAQAAETAGAHGPAVGLDQDWAARVLDAVGTYADVYERNLGPATGLAVPRGLNELWTRGGLHYAVPLH
ncbi:amino acid ABC transporter substrate-binding protein [Streptomyces lucensis JCM 4490]|uniref:Amino acid ABC transporter substrate-binding protein n=1 Tax=Streptomyces lucensis JCM 4490 TaxID=1306176 RepID=A0A918JAM4_9ACTN|nr:transporter substrate-binding domain-containing protein [Streptomyces lucensis]GGW69660.1 amino acid ABC transporter substrate-binding protein [Streptomyces lucensis JCM 4490]